MQTIINDSILCLCIKYEIQMELGIIVKYINTADELFYELDKLNKDNSVLQFTVLGKGKFTLVFQGFNSTTIQEDVNTGDESNKMIHESRKDYKDGRDKTISEMIESLFIEKYS